MSITPSKQTSVYRQVDAILKTEDIYGGRQVVEPVLRNYNNAEAYGFKDIVTKNLIIPLSQHYE